MQKVESMNMSTTLKEFIELLENEDYFEAHEILEEKWHQLKRDEDTKANLARGLINAAVAFEHIKRDTPTASDKANKTYAGYLRHKHLCNGSKGKWKEACDKVEQIATCYGLSL